ncbi:hypothetical protein D3C72_2535010 [compost metagenome]
MASSPTMVLSAASARRLAPKRKGSRLAFVAGSRRLTAFWSDPSATGASWRLSTSRRDCWVNPVLSVSLSDEA